MPTCQIAHIATNTVATTYINRNVIIIAMTDTAGIKNEWDLSCLLGKPGSEEEEVKKNQYEVACAGFVKKWKKRDDYLKRPSALASALSDYEKLVRKYSGGGDVGYYYALKTFLDQSDPALKAKYNKMQDLVTKNDNELEFFTHRISKIPEKKQKNFLEAPQLFPYKHFLELLFLEAKYLLTEDEEKILNLMSPTSYSNWVRMTSDFLAKNEAEVLNEKGKKVTKAFSEIWNDIADKNKQVRDSAVVEFNRIVKENTDVAENELNSIFQTKKVSDELRKMDRPDLARHLADDIDTSAVDALIEAVESRFDISKKYYKLKAQLMGVKKLKYNERTVEYGAFNKKFKYEEAVELVGKAFKRLDGEFYYIFKEMVENGKIDVYPKKGKESSELCVTLLKDKPTYILLNHSGKLIDVTTLAHEMGHAINDELIKKQQNALNLFTPVSTAEVASIFMQDFVLDEVSGFL
jgi:oligoendopeptidase F